MAGRNNCNRKYDYQHQLNDNYEARLKTKIGYWWIVIFKYINIWYMHIKRQIFVYIYYVSKFMNCVHTK